MPRSGRLNQRPKGQRPKRRTTQRKRRGQQTATFAPVAISRQLKTTAAYNSMVFRGKELVDTVNVDYNEPPSMLLELPINVQELGPRLAKQAELWSQFRFKKLRMTVVPACGTSVGGTICHGFDYDTTGPAPTDPTAVQQLAGASSSAIWESSTCVFDARSAIRSQNYYKTEVTTGDIADSTQAFYCLSLVAGINNLTSGIITLNVYADYEVEFTGRKMVTVEPSGEIITLDTAFKVRLDEHIADPNLGGCLFFEVQSEQELFFAQFDPKAYYHMLPADALTTCLTDVAKKPTYCYYSASYKRLYCYADYDKCLARGPTDLVPNGQLHYPAKMMSFIPFHIVTRSSPFRSRVGFSTVRTSGNAIGARRAFCARANSRNVRPEVLGNGCGQGVDRHDKGDGGEYVAAPQDQPDLGGDPSEAVIVLPDGVEELAQQIALLEQKLSALVRQ